MGMRRNNLMHDVGMHKDEDSDYYLKKGLRSESLGSPSLPGRARL
jgi:hypothetical protein